MRKKYPFLDLRIVFEELGEHDKKELFCVANHYTRLSGRHIAKHVAEDILYS